MGVNNDKQFEIIEESVDEAILLLARAQRKFKLTISQLY